jgi:hypothetical protein
MDSNIVFILRVNEENDEPANPSGCHRRLLRWLAGLMILIALVALLIWGAFTFWQMIGGPAYIECLVTSIEPNQCTLGR